MILMLQNLKQSAWRKIRAPGSWKIVSILRRWKVLVQSDWNSSNLLNRSMHSLLRLGNGAMINGIGRIFKERSPQTKIIAVQAAGAPAMIESWRRRQSLSYEQSNTIADGIAVRIPVPEALDDMNGIVDEAVLVRRRLS